MSKRSTPCSSNHQCDTHNEREVLQQRCLREENDVRAMSSSHLTIMSRPCIFTLEINTTIVQKCPQQRDDVENTTIAMYN